VRESVNGREIFKGSFLPREGRLIGGDVRVIFEKQKFRQRNY
jgi:hypothetical protein